MPRGLRRNEKGLVFKDFKGFFPSNPQIQVEKCFFSLGTPELELSALRI
jgi:hypothetical protein